jgi:hypothetical protein
VNVTAGGKEGTRLRREVKKFKCNITSKTKKFKYIYTGILGGFFVGFFRSWVNLRGLSLVSWALSFGGFSVDFSWIFGGFSVDAGRLVFFPFSCWDLRSVLDAFRILRVFPGFFVDFSWIRVDFRGSSVDFLWISVDFGHGIFWPQLMKHLFADEFGGLGWISVDGSSLGEFCGFRWISVSFGGSSVLLWVSFDFGLHFGGCRCGWNLVGFFGSILEGLFPSRLWA